MGNVASCCRNQKNEMIFVTKMDLSHCGCIDVPNVVFHAERCIETLILASNQISSLPPQLFHCQELKHMNLIDNCISSIPPAIGSLVHLVSLRLDKNNLKDLPDDLKSCRKLKRLSLNNNPWKQVPNIATQLISLEEMYMNDCELSFLPASIGRLSKLKILELRNNNLCNLPLSMGRLAILSRLDIGDNEFTEFPACINSLKSLHELLIDNNDIEEITDMKNLINLEHFDASYNHLSVISETVGNCANLNMVNLSFNYLERLPDSIGNIEKLETLQLEMNELTEIPTTIGKLKHLEDLNICNNRLCNIPISIGLLRNLRNFNISNNTVEEFPPEIGSCTKWDLLQTVQLLTIINAGYNRLQVLPSEIGYLNNLKVLDLVGNFLMYLPITIINLRNIRAIWLSANQNVPLIPFTEDLNIASGERFLTNIALPQLGEIPFRDHQNHLENEEVVHEKSSWGKKIRFAEDDDILPGILHRTPTPFPKELRAPVRRQHIRNDGSKNNDDYANIINSKTCEAELQPPRDPIKKNGSGILSLNESCVTMIREANIRKNKDLAHTKCTEQHCAANIISSDQSQGSDLNFVYLCHSLSGSCNTAEGSAETAFATENPSNRDYSLNEVNLFVSPYSNNNNNNNNNSNESMEQELTMQLASDVGMKNLNEPNTQFNNIETKGAKENPDNGTNEREIYSYKSRINNEWNKKPDVPFHSQFSRMKSNRNNSLLESDFNSNGEISRLQLDNPLHESFIYKQSNGFNVQCSSYLNNVVTTTDANCVNDDQCDNASEMHTVPKNEGGKYTNKQDMILLTEKMRSKNISPPCYEIAKMYSTKAALFEQHRIEN